MKKKLLLLLCFLIAFTLFSASAHAEYTDSVPDESETSAAEANIFDAVYAEIIKHSDKILSALAFSASLILAFAYKKGFLPLIKGALSALTSSVSKLKEETESASLAAQSSIEGASAKLENAQELLASLTERLETIEGKLAASAEEKNLQRDIKKVMTAQVDMLYSIFMSSSIPAYQKEAVGESIAEMKKTLTASEGKDQ